MSFGISIGPSTGATGAPEAAARRKRERSSDEESKLARNTTFAALGLGALKAQGVDRGRLGFVAVQRLRAHGVRAAARQVRHNPGATIRQLVRDPLVWDLVRGPTTDSVRINAGRWKAMHYTSGILGIAASGTALAAAYLSYQDAKSGDGGLLDSTTGRNALLLAGEQAWFLGWAGFAGVARRDAGQGFIKAATGSSWLAKPMARTVRCGVGAVFAAAIGANWLHHEVTKKK